MYLIEKWIKISISCVLVMFTIGPSVLDGQEAEYRVGLVLSGGGARGAAHIGILKVLERENIPIDCIAGTSFGALVGGLYALGYRAAEIEEIFIQQDWSRFFSDAPERQLAPFSERKNSDLQVHLSISNGMPELPSGVWEIQQLREILNERTTEPMLKAQSDFDRLYIPFRAVATDLINNKQHIFREGSMTEALRASIAIPGILTPVEKGNTLLVDGGLKNNLPTDIARNEMGADYIIAVDVSSPLLGKDEIRSLLDVTDQAQSLQIQDNMEKNRHFTPGVLMTPDLDGFTMLDFSEMPEIIKRGEKEAEKWLEKFKEEVGVRRQKTRPDRKPEERIIDSVGYKGLTNVSRRQMEREIRTRPGKKMDLSVLISDMKRLYATNLFDSVDFNLERISGNHYELTFKVKEASMLTLDAGIRYDNDYEFVAMAEFTTRQLFTSPTSFTITSQFGGLEDHSAAFRYTPAIIPFLFIETEAHARRRERQYFKDRKWDGAYTEEFLGGQIRFGGTIWNQLEIAAGYHLDYVDIIGGIEDRDLPEPQKLAGLTLRLSCDTLDDQEFPTRGMDLELAADSAGKHFGGDLNYLKVLLKYDKYWPISDQSTLGFNLQMGDMGVDAPFYDSFYIGGYSFSRKGSYPLLGFDRDEVLSREMAVARIEYRRRIYDPSFGIVKNAYLTALFNAGAVQGVPGTDLLGAGVGLALDTILGPVRLTGGFGTEGRAHFHFTLGPTF